MRIAVSAKSPSAVAADCLVCLSHPTQVLSVPTAKSAQAALVDYSRAVKSGRMSRLDMASAPAGSKAARLLLAGVVLGASKTWPPSEQFRGAASQVYAHCKAGGARRVAFLLNGPDGAAAAPWIAEGLLLGAYSFQPYKSKPSEFVNKFSAELLVSEDALAATKAAVQEAVRLCECINQARDLINQPGSVAIPSYIAQIATEVAQEVGLDVEVWDEARLREEGYNGLLTVGRGSADPPRMVVLRHRPADAPESPRLCLVGKGITFDSGGMCLKSSEKMWQMLDDMSGAAGVLAAMKAIAQSRVPLNVTGILCLTQNYIGPTAVKPGDIFVAKNGKTVHVLNTDAEGRLVLTDGLARAGEEGATHIVDVATLTGAISRAFGDSLSGQFSNNPEWAGRIQAIGESEGEALWPLPLFGEYRKHLDDYRADIQNTTAQGQGGALTAPLFLREFVPEGAAWAHLDIAGTAFQTGRWRYLAPGGRGVMVRTLRRLAMEMSQASSGAQGK